MSADEDHLPAYYRAPFPTFGQRGMVVSDHPRASQAGREVLRKGGNAVDAAVAVSLALGVVCPYYTGIGGGGFMLVWLPEMEKPHLLDYREVAPAAAHPQLYSGPGACSMIGGMAIGVPGTIRGLSLLLEKFGKLSWAQVLEPAIALAESEIEIDANYARITECKRAQIALKAGASRLFLPQGKVALPGTKVVHPDLAGTYRQLAERGAEDFYQGELAARIVQASTEHGGILTLADLSGYRPLWREPLCQNYRGHQVCTIGPPSGGGIQVLQILRMLETFAVQPGDWGTVQGLHRLGEAMRISFHERSTRVADPAFGDIPVDWLLDESRLRELAARIRPDRVLQFQDRPVEAHSAGGTASFVTSASDGSMVAATESVNLWHGSMVVPSGSGFVLNNVMDDFNCFPGQPDAFGLISSALNQVEPGKRPASSSSPVLVGLGGRPVLAAGSAGGPRIATSVCQMLLNHLDYGMNIQQAVSAVRIHHQWSPDELAVEPQVSWEIRRGLEAIGHHIAESSCRSHGCALRYHAEEDFYTGGADFRSFSSAAGL